MFCQKPQVVTGRPKQRKWKRERHTTTGCRNSDRNQKSCVVFLLWHLIACAVASSMRPIQPSSMYTHSRHKCANPLPKQQGKTPKPRKIVTKTKKKTLSQLVKSKMTGIKFISRVSKQAERRKQKEQSMHASHFILASIFHFSSFRAAHFILHIPHAQSAKYG